MLACVLLLLAAWACLDAGAGRAASPGRRPPVLLMFHCGGFFFDCTTPCLPYAQSVASSYGFQPRVIDYPLGSVPAAMRSAIAAVPARRWAYAYGESAGGLLAARLAQRGSVRAAAIQSPVSNLPFYLALAQPGFPLVPAEVFGVPTLREQRCYSPLHHRTIRPILATAAEEDVLSPPTLRWARKATRVFGISVPGPHLPAAMSPLYTDRVQLLIRWLACRARLLLCGRG